MSSLTRYLQADDTDEEDLSDSTSPAELVLAVGLFFLMLGVGSSCKWELFRQMIRSPKALKAAAVGVMCQFLLMPVVAFTLVKVFQVDSYSAFGYILAGAMPGGSTSNVFTLWGSGIIELSVFMTIISTIMSFGMIPFWVFVFSNAVNLENEDGDGDDYPPIAMDQIAITLAMLIVPLSLGVSLNFFTWATKFRYLLERAIHILAIAILVTAIVLAVVEYPKALTEYTTWAIGVSAFIYFPIATGISYGITTLIGFPPSAKRTVVMEVGLQNVALGFAIGEKALTQQSQREQTIPFPILFCIFMYFWAFLLVPIFRRQKRRNEEQGVVDNDPEFLLVVSEVELEAEKDNVVEIKEGVTKESSLEVSTETKEDTQSQDEPADLNI